MNDGTFLDLNGQSSILRRTMVRLFYSNHACTLKLAAGIAGAQAD